jgi:hypothetical protein
VIDIQEAEQKDTAVSVLQNLQPALRTNGREKNPVLHGSARNAPAGFCRVIGGFHFAPLPLHRRPARALLTSCLSLGPAEYFLNDRAGEKRHHGWQHSLGYHLIMDIVKSFARLANREFKQPTLYL